MRTVPRLVLLGALLAGAVAACGGSAGASGPTVVVTSSILGDVVGHLVGADADVQVLMPPNADPHDFAPSARQAAELRRADVVVQNGLGFEHGLADTIEAARRDGVTVLTAADAIEPLPLGGSDQPDPHFFTDPARMQQVAVWLADHLASVVPSLDAAAARARVARYVDELARLDRRVGDLLASIPSDDRTLVTNHESLGYFADRYGFDVIGTVIPGGSPLAAPSARSLRDLGDEIEQAGVPAIFAETSSPSRLADALAAEGTDVDVVELYTESLGPAGSAGDTYVHLLMTDAERIAAALGPRS